MKNVLDENEIRKEIENTWKNPEKIKTILFKNPKLKTKEDKKKYTEALTALFGK